tara:strand:+ start:22729 stop:23481 length:753 start_codon:yes stop_codon:yes gene_type:complete
LIRTILCFICFFTHSASYSASANSAPLHVYIAEYPPFQILDEEKGHTGFSVELFKEIVKLTQIEVEYIAVPWVRAQSIVAEQANSVLFSMAKTPERDKLYTWVDTIYLVNEGVFALRDRKDITINSLEDVHKYSIALPRGDVSITTLNIFPNNTDDVVIVEHQEQCIKMLNLSRVDLNYNNDVGFFVAAKMLGFSPDQFKQVFITRQTELGIAANKNTNPESLNKIRQAMLTLKENGVYERLQQTWFGDM